jgi:DNA adenine methylase
MMAKPFIKWVGGKRQLLPELIDHLPAEFDNYYEPFLGGGALFWHLYGQMANVKWYLSDVNIQLIGVYNAVKYACDTLINDLGVMARIYNASPEECYYKIRAKFNTQSAGVSNGVNLLFLNKAGFNGLYRVNKHGIFNTPWGKVTNPTFNIENLKACSRILNETNVQIEAHAFKNVFTDAKKGDFIYCDPPYDKVNTTSFTNYTNGSDIQKELKECCDIASQKGVNMMVSNADTQRVRILYSNYHIHEIMARRSVNSDGDNRGKVKELIITNY